MSLDPVRVSDKSVKTVRMLLFVWAAGLILSFFVTHFSAMAEPLVVISLIVCLAMIAGIFIMWKKLAISSNFDRSMYVLLRYSGGYGLVFTYVFTSMSRVAGEFHGSMSISGRVIGFSVSILISLIPAALYLILRNRRFRLLTCLWTEVELNEEKTRKKDKKKHKAHQKQLRKDRSFLQNLWYEWVDVILSSILIVMVINQFLFQMYAIPSESMVPTFLKKDRVMVNKGVFGFYMPLTEWKIPGIRKPHMGDIVVFLNPAKDDPESEIHYENLFSRVFHPFIYMLTFSAVDIDKKENGDPKERMWVKRLMGEPGEQVCLVNDRVYKKTDDSGWVMVDPAYGQYNLFDDENPKMDYQRMNRQIRSRLDHVAEMIEVQTDLQESLSAEKLQLQSLISRADSRVLQKSAEQFSLMYRTGMRDVLQYTLYQYYNLTIINTQDVADAERQKWHDDMEKALDFYKLPVFSQILSRIQELSALTSKDSSFIEKELITKVGEGDDPYSSYMNKVNALYKLTELRIMNYFLSDYDNFQGPDQNGNWPEALSSLLNDMTDLVIYTDGIAVPDAKGNTGSEFLSFYDNSHFPVYPENRVLSPSEFFVMGDNRYNSLDSRMGYDKHTVYLDENDMSWFGKSVIVSWHAHAIDLKYITGRVFTRAFPFNRFRIFW